MLDYSLRGKSIAGRLRGCDWQHHHQIQHNCSHDSPPLHGIK